MPWRGNTVGNQAKGQTPLQNAHNTLILHWLIFVGTTFDVGKSGDTTLAAPA